MADPGLKYSLTLILREMPSKLHVRSEAWVRISGRDQPDGALMLCLPDQDSHQASE